ncbi:(2Fe-2S)-binding protein, partial [Pseudomonas sp. GW704-F3]
MTSQTPSRRDRIGDVAEILLDYVEHKTTHQAPSTTQVRTATYTDPDQW